ncbi:hypothetical protein [Methylotuvimicrobium sp. KM2]|uniref:hypothetical protein n=1 Tax=Methylotuvimicrobium sp. KM2 TaxID=3133976 RepID=UPI003101B101
MHDQNFKNLILDYPVQALQFFAAEEAPDDLPQARIIPFRQEQLKERLGDRFHELDTPLLVEWLDGRREVILFFLEEETEARRFSIYRLAHYCLDLAELAQTDRVVPIVIFLDRGRHSYELHLGGERHNYLSFRYIACELKNLSADAYRDSDNIVARLNLPNMRYAKGQKLDIYHDAQLGLALLEQDPNKQLKYVDFVDYYADLTDAEIETYRNDYLPEAEDRMGLAQILREEGRKEGEIKGGIKGEIRGEAQTLTKQIQLKFGELPIWVEEKINQADKSQLDQWVERILFVDTLEQLFKP